MRFYYARAGLWGITVILATLNLWGPAALTFAFGWAMHLRLAQLESYVPRYALTGDVVDPETGEVLVDFEDPDWRDALRAVCGEGRLT